MEWNAVWENFIADLLAGIVIAVVFGLLFPYWVEKIRTPKNVRFIMRGVQGNRITPMIKNKKEKEFTLGLEVKNSGNIAIMNSIYWTLYIPREIKVSIRTKDANLHKEAFGNWTKIFGKVDGPLFPQRPVPLVATFACKFFSESLSPSRSLILYRFSTEFGMYPKRVRRVVKDLNEQTLWQLRKKMGTLVIE